MFYNDKKTIGVFISQVNHEFQDLLSKGIMTRAKELDYNVAFFTNFGGYGQESYDLGELYIADLPNYEELDGIIIAPGTIIIKNLEQTYHRNIRSRAKCPVVSVKREYSDYYNVLIDDSTVLNEIIRHFIEVHGFTRINFLAGPKGHPDSESRLETYKRILTEYNIPIEQERIYYGDFWKTEAISAVDYWLNSSLEWPQAIICANDYMAITACKALIERGISIPEQIAISGCDDIEDAAEFSPSITTVRTPVFEMGVEAVEKIHRHLQGIHQPRNSYLQTVTIYRASCGCKRNWYHESNERRRNHISVRENLTREISRNAYMSTDLAGLTKLEDVIDKIWDYTFENINFTHFCLCLRKNWDKYSEEEDKTEDANEITMEMGYKNRVGYNKLKVEKKELIPPELAEDKAMAYFFAVLHHQEHYFGYVGISFDRIQTYMLTFQAWIINICNALENIRMHGELNRLLYRLEDMSIRDDLTGLYNRRVLETLGKKYLKQCVEQESMLMVFTADMDKLKYINDNYGHFQGDAALKMVSDALQHASDDDEICIRLGGDEFMAIGIDYDQIKLMKFVNRFVEELNSINEAKQFEFDIYVSYGYNLVLPDERTTIEGCMRIADSRMYQQKYEKASKQIKGNLVC